VIFQLIAREEEEKQKGVGDSVAPLILQLKATENAEKNYN
jgi:hypothetical protein